MIGHHDVARLLAAQIEPALAHPLDHISIANGRAFKPQIQTFKIMLQPEVGHDGRHQGPALQAASHRPTPRQQRHDLIPIGHFAVLINHHHAVGVTVQTDPQIGPVCHNSFSSQPRVGRAAFLIDVGPVGRHAHRYDLGPQFPKHFGRRLVGRAIGTIDNHFQSRKPQPLRNRGFDPLHIAVAPVFDPLGPPDIFSSNRLDPIGHHSLDLGFGLIGQFVAIGPEKLDAIVLMRIVAGGNHHAHIGPHRCCDHPNRRRGRWAQKKDIHAGRGKARRQRIFEHIAGQAGVLADHHTVVGLTVPPKIAPGGCAKFQGDLCGHGCGVCPPAHTVGAK